MTDAQNDTAHATDPLAHRPARPGTPEAGWQTLAHLYHVYFTGLILHVTLELGRETAGKWSFRYFRRQHEQKFLSSFEKLGAAGLPDAVAAARYHFLSNRIGGVEVEYVYESDRKAWIRFPHPRWIYDGTALCGVPLEVGQGFIHGWYGQNGVTLNNPRLGWVCTSQDAKAEIGYAGYFFEYDHDLAPDERVRYVTGEAPPPFDAAAAPTLDLSIWTAERLAKARRNYAMDYVKWGLVELVELIGHERTRAVAKHAAAIIGRQFYRDFQAKLGCPRAETDAAAFRRFMTLITEAHGDEPESGDVDGEGFGQSAWRLVRGMGSLDADTAAVMFDAWNEIWAGCLSVHNRFLTWTVAARPTTADDAIRWRIGTGPGA